MVGSNGLSLDKLLLIAKKKRLCIGAACSTRTLKRQVMEFDDGLIVILWRFAATYMRAKYNRAEVLNSNSRVPRLCTQSSVMRIRG